MAGVEVAVGSVETIAVKSTVESKIPGDEVAPVESNEKFTEEAQVTETPAEVNEEVNPPAENGTCATETSPKVDEEAAQIPPPAEDGNCPADEVISVNPQETQIPAEETPKETASEETVAPELEKVEAFTEDKNDEEAMATGSKRPTEETATETEGSAAAESPTVKPTTVQDAPAATEENASSEN
eukprot:Gb_14195 [translate_table: standard]